MRYHIGGYLILYKKGTDQVGVKLKVNLSGLFYGF